jgi:hypothetical protein
VSSGLEKRLSSSPYNAAPHCGHDFADESISAPHCRQVLVGFIDWLIGRAFGYMGSDPPLADAPRSGSILRAKARAMSPMSGERNRERRNQLRGLRPFWVAPQAVRMQSASQRMNTIM